MRPIPTPILALAALAALAGCTSSLPAAFPPRPLEQADDLVRTVIGRQVAVGGPKVTPLAVLEDSRCPMNARCVWAGRVRLSVRIELGSGSQVREITQGQPIPVADGTLELVEVQPDKVAGGDPPALKPGDYRCGFRFLGGL
jgi:hypothetical protein